MLCQNLTAVSDSRIKQTSRDAYRENYLNTHRKEETNNKYIGELETHIWTDFLNFSTIAVTLTFDA